MERDFCQKCLQGYFRFIKSHKVVWTFVLKKLNGLINRRTTMKFTRNRDTASANCLPNHNGSDDVTGTSSCNDWRNRRRHKAEDGDNYAGNFLRFVKVNSVCVVFLAGVKGRL